MGDDVPALAPDSVQQGALGHPCGREDGIGPDHLMKVVLLVEVGDPDPPGALLLIDVPEDQAPLELPADALEGGAGQHPLGGASLPDIEVNPRSGVCRVHDAGDVAVCDQIDPGADRADRGDDLGVTGPVQNTDSDLLRRDPLGRGQSPNIVGRRAVKVDHPSGITRPAGDLVHIGVRGVQKGALGRPRHHRKGVGHGLGGKGRAFQWVEGDINGRAATSNLLPDIETTASNDYIAELEAKAKGFTVRIDSSSKTNGSGVIANGSGVIIAKEGNIYTVLTADHVLCGEMARTDSCADYTYTVVTSDGKTRNIEKSTIIRQEGVDLAVFQFESLDNYPVAEIANYNPNSGDFVFAAGFPKIGQNPSKWLFSGGAIHDKEQGLLQTRQSPLSTQQGGTLQSVASLTGGYELVYTSITFGGMSGGAVLDSQGRVIGIHGRSEGAGGGKIQLGFSLGIPISTFIGLQERLKVKPQLLTTAQPQVSPQQQQEIIQAIAGVIVPNTNAKADIWIQRGGQLWRLRRHEEAIKAFDEAIKQNESENVYLAWYGKGLALGYLGKDQPAIEALQQAINTLPKREDLKKFHSSILQKQSVVYRYLENYEQALSVINQAISLVPNNPNYYNEKSGVLSRLKRYDEGLAAITQAIDLAPRAAWYFSRGNLYYNLQKYDLALSDWNKAIKINPNYAECYCDECHNAVSLCRVL